MLEDTLTKEYSVPVFINSKCVGYSGTSQLIFKQSKETEGKMSMTKEASKMITAPGIS